VVLLSKGVRWAGAVIYNAGIGCRELNSGLRYLLNILSINMLLPYVLACFLQMALPVAAIEVGQQAACVFFDIEAKTTFTREFMKSKF
jgi:hypothetical protein